jgi:hypothetical protein
VADVETRTSKSPCRYLGLRLGDTYEPDPQLWPPEALGERKSHASVVYEWAHVTAGGKHHTVTCRINNILGGGQRVPLNPLRVYPSGLTLDIEFFHQVGANVREGVFFKGIAYESDRPDIIAEVPNNGRDVQGEPVHGT